MKVRCVAIQYTKEGPEYVFEDPDTDGENATVTIRSKTPFEIGKFYTLSIA
jgi:hypothetical protein